MQCPNFNTHVVKDDAARLIEILHNNSYGNEKCPEPDEETDDEDDANERDDSKLASAPSTPDARNLELEMIDKE